MNVDLYKNIFFVGIGGIGMSALARYFNKKNKSVYGYDMTKSDLCIQLQNEGVDIIYNDNSSNIFKEIYQSDTNETLIIYRELYQKGLTGEDLATRIFEFEKEDRLSVSGVLDGAAWARTGATGPTVGEVLSRAGHKLRRADKNRIQGKIQIHERLKLNDKGRPKLQIFKSCPNLIREIQSIPIDPSRPEDVDTKASDHAYDALRYLVMSRPRATSVWEEMSNKKRWTPSDPTFGY